MEAKPTEMRERPLEGPGSDARLRRLQMRFAKLHRRSFEETRGSPWRFGLLCMLTFMGVFAVGLLVLR